ncbi:hypothetical protein [Riemerella anatipestifer]|uniref:hypothetical protein n=1 Tax=Riemerella anatipestifer TaxID=34085 RepID=UPI0030C2AE0B
MERNIFYQLIPEMIDNSCLLPPPPPLAEDSRGEYDKLLDSIKNSNKIVAISDTIYNYTKDELRRLNLPKEFEIDEIQTYDKKNTINLDSLKVSLNIQIKNSNKLTGLDEYLKGEGNWSDYPSLKDLKCMMSFSRIIFNKNKSQGFFTFGVVCGKHCGSGFKVWIKNINGKWFIEKQQSTWVA